MARMLHPSPGEIADRQTILNLKMNGKKNQQIQHALTPGAGSNPAGKAPANHAVDALKDEDGGGTHHFVEEHRSLQGYLEAYWLREKASDVMPMYTQLFERLAAINEQLWNREDEARRLRSSPQEPSIINEAGKLLFEITRLNDDRAEVVLEINKLFGVTEREKIYA